MGLSTLAGLALFLQTPLVIAQGMAEEQSNETWIKQNQGNPDLVEQRAKITHAAYILGPGDGLEIELLDLPELSGLFLIGPDGTLHLPLLRSLYVEGLTIEELRQYLTQKFKTYVLDPQVNIRPVIYRPIRIYVGGEVKRPGYYKLTAAQSTTRENTPSEFLTSQRGAPLSTGSSLTSNLFNNIPTVFDAIRSAQGVTPYSNLSQVQVTRKRSEGQGGGRIRTNLNFLSLITEGNESQNIRLFDGDVVKVGKSNEVLVDQFIKANQSNLSPAFIQVFVFGRVNNPGGIQLPQASSLNQAIAMAGGAKLIKGKVEFVRFTQKGKTDRRLINYEPGAPVGTPNNPLLSSGDLIRVRESILSSTTTIIDEITAPAMGIYSILTLIDNVK